MSEGRPDPDALLARVRAEEAKQARGKLKIFFGAAPGVGKTYSMLEAARKAGKEGLDVVVGYLEPHSRPETQALVLGLDVLPRRQVLYHGAKLLEFDLEVALARRPQLILVDELAHTNAPDLTHAKRWQDVVRLLDAGIDVYTTLNVQHLDSLKDVVAQITGVTVRETVPDAIFEEADEVELVDLPPDDLLDRLREGKVYVPREAERAVANFFSKGNLIALRELALRRTAERVGAQMEDYRQRQGVLRTWPARERLLVCIGPSPFAERLVRATRRMAASLKVPWTAVHVETPVRRVSDADRLRLERTMHLVQELGGETVMLEGQNVADEALHYGRSHNVTRIVIGKPKQSRWRDLLAGSLVYDLTRKCGDIDVYVISGDERAGTASPSGSSALTGRRGDYFRAVLVVLACTAIGALLSPYLAPTNLAMIYLLGVVAVALRLGRGPSILASVLSVAAFDFCFVPPWWTFAVADTQYLLTFGVMLAIGLLISTLTARVKFQVESARRRERRTAALYAMGRELASVQGRVRIAQVAAEHVRAAADMPTVILLPNPDGRLVPLATGVGEFVPSPHDEAVAEWVFEHGQVAGQGMDTLPGAEGIYLPLPASHRTVGVLGVLPGRDRQGRDPDWLHLLEAFAGLIALAVERANLTAESERIRLQMETEQLRSSLLSAVSHDLRTPLSVIIGAGSTLLDGEDSLDAEARRELIASVLDEAQRLNRLVANLLDMTRLEAGALEVHKDEQPAEEIIGAALERLSAQLRDHPVQTRIQPEMPFVPMDGLLIEQVLINLLENAVRHTPPGTPIEVSAGTDGRSLLVEVADAGPGLPEVDPERLFEKFYRADVSRGRPGAGLGLAICRGIVNLHGGTIHAENRAGGGAVFRVRLPLGGPSTAMAPEAVPVPPPLNP